MDGERGKTLRHQPQSGLLSGHSLFAFLGAFVVAAGVSTGALHRFYNIDASPNSSVSAVCSDGDRADGVRVQLDFQSPNARISGSAISDGLCLSLSIDEKSGFSFSQYDKSNGQGVILPVLWSLCVFGTYILGNVGSPVSC